MGNIAYKSFKRNVTNGQFLEMLQAAIADFCPNEYEAVLELGEPNSFQKGKWVVKPRENIIPEEYSWAYQIEIYRESARKFGNKQMCCGDWGNWFYIQLSGRLCRDHGATLSDEGVSGTWKTDPKNYSTFENYLNQAYAKTKSRNPERWDEMKQIFLDDVPEKLKGI